MDNTPKWIAGSESKCMQNWTDYLHIEAKRLFHQDGTHANLLFCFNRLLWKLHLVDKIAIFGIFILKFFDHMLTYALKI